MGDGNSTFWGLILQPGKRYEQVVEKSFHVSMAALDISGSSDKATVQVMINVDGQEFILCHLSKNRNPQQSLDLNFQGGDSLALYVDGQSPQPVHLTGFYNEIDDDDDLDGLEMSDMSDEEEVPELVPAKLGSAKKKAIELAKNGSKGDSEAAPKRKASPTKENPQKKAKLQNSVVSEDLDDDDDDEDEDADEEEVDEEGEDEEDEELEEGFSDEDDDDDEDDEDDDDEDEEEDDEEEVDEPPIALKKSKSPAVKKELAQEAAKPNGVAKASETPKTKKGATPEQTKKTLVQQEKKAAQTPKEDVSDEDDDDEDDDEEDDDDEDDDEDDDDDDEVNEPPIALKKSKSPAVKKELTQEATKPNGVAKVGETPKKKKGAAPEQAQKTPVQQEKKAAQTPKSAKRTIGGGVMVEDMIVGNGPVAKRGRPVSVYYVGRLKQNNKQFDQTTGGPGFKFRLGAKEVIKGWDVGVEGMKVGGKRRITCPPHMAYGARGSPPVIPPNSALVFDVTLKNVH